MTFTIELDDAVLQNLKAEAEKQDIALNDWIVLKLQRDLEVESSTRSEVVSDDEFEAAVRYTLDKNAELYRRLA